MSRKRVVLLVIGSIIVLIGFALFAGGAWLGWAVATQRDEDGFFTTSNDRYVSATPAITSREVDLGRPGPIEWWSDRHIVTVRVRVSGTTERQIFVGIAPAQDVEMYLRGVPHDEVTSVRFDPFKVRYRLENTDGTAAPADPTGQSFWVASATGRGEQTVTWGVERGRWELVVMNADGARGVAVDVQAGVRVQYLAQVAIALAVGGLLLLAGGAVLIVPSVREHRPPEAGAATAPSVGAIGGGPSAYPVQVAGHLDAPLSRWKWLIKWFLAIPHFLVLVFLWIAFTVLTIVAFFAILFTGRYPRDIFRFNVGVLRWTWRVTYYCTSVMGTDRYPPFTLDEVDYPATFDVVYPEHLSRGLIFVKSWLLAIPHLVIIGILTSATTLSGSSTGWKITFGGGLVGVLTTIAVVTLLFCGRYPKDLHELLVGLNRWVLRVIAYVALMTDEYPPFRLDQGPDEPRGGREMTEVPSAPPAPGRSMIS